MLEAQKRFAVSDQKGDAQQLNPLQKEAAGESMKSIFRLNSGVTQSQLQHAVEIANALPEDIKQVLLLNHVEMALSTGWNRTLAAGRNLGTVGNVYTDSGMADQALVHELYEMAGQDSLSTLKGTWNDADAVVIADNDTVKIRNGQGRDPGDLDDTLSLFQFNNGFEDKNTVTGDGDLMSNAFTADFFATHPTLYKDTSSGSTPLATIQDAPDLVNYIAKAQGLDTAVNNSHLPFGDT